jgi:hypothetical protein
VSGGAKLSHHQERAISALLSTRTIPEAASAAGVSARTLERWLAESDGFSAAYRAARRQVVEVAIGRLQDATGDAVATLSRNLTCGKPAVEVRAALGILEQAIKAVELWDLEERLSELEGRNEPG